MSQMFLELQPKIKNCLLEEYNQKALARIAMSQILLQLQKKHNVIAGNIRKLSFELLSQPSIRIAENKYCWLEE
jgi:hypothetical protein